LTRADTQALGLLDHLPAEERRLEQTYSLPFRAPQHVATTVHACPRCGQDLLLLIFGDQARDEEGLLAYGRLMHEAIVACGLPAYVLGAREGDGALDDTPSLLLQVWPTPGEPQRVTPGRPITTIRAKMGHIAPIDQVAICDRIVATKLDRDRAGNGPYRHSSPCNKRITGRVEAFIPPESGPVMQLSR